MKQLVQLIAVVLLVLTGRPSSAQNINWKNLDAAQKHIVNFRLGFDYAAVAGIGYGFHLKKKLPVVLNIEYSQPFGEIVFDDLKTKIGGQVNFLRAGSFYATAKAYGIIRRFQNDFARMINFGSEFSATAGLYKRKWFIAAELGFDKAIVTHIKHSELMKEYNPGLESGWYIPTAGNLFYGLQGGYSFKKNDLYARFGNTLEQDFKSKPLVPYYFELGTSIKL